MNVFLLCAFLTPLLMQPLASYRTEAGFLLLLVTYIVWGRTIKRFDNNKKILHGELLVFAAVICLYVYLGISKTALGGMNLLQVLWAAVSVIALFVFWKYTPGQRSRMFVILNILCFVSVLLELRNGIRFLHDPKHGDAYSVAYMSTFAFIYLCINYFLFLNLKKRWHKLICLLPAIVTFGVLVFVFERGISTLICLACIIALYILSSKPKKVFFVCCILGLGLIAVYVFPDAVTGFINAHLNGRIANRLSRVIAVFSGAGEGGINGSFQIRLHLIGRSLETWTHSFANFLVGIGEHTEKDYCYKGLYFNSLISNHSDFIDILPKYGVFAGLLMFDILRRQYRETVSHIQNGRHKAQVSVIYAGIVVRGLIGSVLVPTVAVATLLLPLAAEYCEMKTEPDDIHN